METAGLLGCMIYIFTVGYYIADRIDKWMMSVRKVEDGVWEF